METATKFRQEGTVYRGREGEEWITIDVACVGGCKRTWSRNVKTKCLQITLFSKADYDALSEVVPFLVARCTTCRGERVANLRGPAYAVNADEAFSILSTLATRAEQVVKKRVWTPVWRGEGSDGNRGYRVHGVDGHGGGKPADKVVGKRGVDRTMSCVFVYDDIYIAMCSTSSGRITNK